MESMMPSSSGEMMLQQGRQMLTALPPHAATSARAELPGFARISKELAGRVNFVGVNSLDDGRGLGMPITAFYDRGGKLVGVAGGALPERYAASEASRSAQVLVK